MPITKTQRLAFKCDACGVTHNTQDKDMHNEAIYPIRELPKGWQGFGRGATTPRSTARIILYASTITRKELRSHDQGSEEMQNEQCG